MVGRTLQRAHQEGEALHEEDLADITSDRGGAPDPAAGSGGDAELTAAHLCLD